MPVTPGATGASFDVLLAFSLDAAANARVQQGASTLEAELKRIQDEAKGVGEKYEESGEKVQKTSKEIARTLRAEARAMRAEAGAIIDDIQQAQIQTLNTISGAIGQASQKALILGSALTVGIFAEVNQYVNKAPQATRETQAWARAMGELGRSREKVDQELLRSALPLLQQAARLSTQAAGIVQRHPEITNMALKAGTILVGVGAIGMAVSRGIKLVADVKSLAQIPIQLQAARLQDMAGDKMLAAAQIQLKAAGGTAAAPRGRSILSPIPLLSILAGGAAYGALGRSASNFGASLFGTTPEKFWKDLIARVGESVPFVKKITDEIGVLGRVSNQAGSDISKASGMIRGSANEAAIVEAFSSWKEDDARLVREAADNRKKIIEEGERAIAEITRNYMNQRVSINKRFNAQAAEIRDRFEQDSAEATARYQEDRAQVIRDGIDREREIVESAQERLEQIRRESEDRLEEFDAARDALGRAKEEERLAQALQQENESINAERARVRKETAQRLEELDRQFAVETARRQAQFEQELAQNEAQRAEELKQAAETHQAEIRQAREAQAQKLREIQEGLNAERLRRREVMISQIRDLDSALLGEKNLRTRYYQEMLRDAEAFFAAYRRSLPGGSGSPFAGVTGSAGLIPTQDSGGYATRGVYGLAMNGIPEFVLSGSTTRAAERAVGASLTDESMGRLFSRLGDMRTAVYNDNRRLDAPLSKDARDIYRKTAEEALLRVLGA